MLPKYKQRYINSGEDKPPGNLIRFVHVVDNELPFLIAWFQFRFVIILIEKWEVKLLFFLLLCEYLTSIETLFRNVVGNLRKTSDFLVGFLNEDIIFGEKLESLNVVPHKNLLEI